jgi:hypothetical protein
MEIHYILSSFLVSLMTHNTFIWGSVSIYPRVRASIYGCSHRDGVQSMWSGLGPQIVGNALPMTRIWIFRGPGLWLRLRWSTGMELIACIQSVAGEQRKATLPKLQPLPCSYFHRDLPSRVNLPVGCFGRVWESTLGATTCGFFNLCWQLAEKVIFFHHASHYPIFQVQNMVIISHHRMRR